MSDSHTDGRQSMGADGAPAESPCNDTLRALEIFLDDELSDEAREAIRHHLGGCNDCLEAFDFHAELRTVIAAKCRDDEMPPTLMARIEACFGPDSLTDDD